MKKVSEIFSTSETSKEEKVTEPVTEEKKQAETKSKEPEGKDISKGITFPIRNQSSLMFYIFEICFCE